MSNFLEDILLHWTRNLRIPVSTIADWAECDEKTIYAYMSGTRDMPYRRLRRCARQISAIYGDNQPALSLLGTAFTVSRKGEASVNHDVDDDIAEATEACGDLRRAYREGNRRNYFGALARLENEFNDLHGEGEQL